MLLGGLVGRRFFSSNIGFIGLGNMGLPMVRNLLKHGNKVTAFDISEPACTAAAQAGAVIKSSIAEVSKEKDVVVTMLPEGKDVRKALTSPDGVFANAAPGTVIFDSSTIAPKESLELMLEGKKKGFITADAPVTGGTLGAEAGTLTYLVGCEKDNFPKIKKTVSQMGKNIFHCGELGAGASAKLCNNLAFAIQMRSVAEAMSLGQKLGLDAKLLSEIMVNGSSRCFSVETYHPVPGIKEGVPSSNKYDGGFPTSLIRKDLALVRDAAEEVGLNLEMSKKCEELYSRLEKLGHGRKDFSIVYQHVYHRGEF